MKRITFSIDGTAVGEGSLPACSAGGCSGSKTFSIDMSAYSGGAHPAVVAAEDYAGNVRKKSWTINVDPEGHVSASEAEDTLEAVEVTAPETTEYGPVSAIVAAGNGEAEMNPELVDEGGALVSKGTSAPSAIGSGAEDGFFVESTVMDGSENLHRLLLAGDRHEICRLPGELDDRW